ncbi:MAG: diacylglycerol/lipid kinase family protein [Myxococcota bacterium]
MSAVELIGRGGRVAGWFNTHAKRVTPLRVEAFRRQLPEARVFTASTFDEAKVHADELAKELPDVIFCGGGDGTVVTLLNFLRERGVKKFPLVGLFRLGTGNGWPSAVGARRYERELTHLPDVPLQAPTQHFELLEVEGRVCQFAGVGWDATLLHDYKRNLEKRQKQLVAGPLAHTMSKGLGGYLYSLFRLTVPGELARLREGRTRLRLENLGEPALTFDGRNQIIHAPNDPHLYEGPMSVASAGTEPYWGAKFKAFPHARLVPGRFNFRVYDRQVLVGVNNMFKLWQGHDVPGMYDWWLTGVRLHLSRPMPYQVAGDVVEPREVLDFTLAKESVELVDWAAVAKLLRGK